MEWKKGFKWTNSSCRHHCKFLLHGEKETYVKVNTIHNFRFMGTGIKLGSDAPATLNTTHRNVAIALFCIATLQMFGTARTKPDSNVRDHRSGKLLG
ncbi:hypothetical protein Ddye_016063 [Dipteronia dyeriana]|uniref:Uncharacterized protein n=1 Tax=Dipteronia dyeriana TaxID=168575 RepID=A0AAD9U702_9ROSI|nr:hypothetical protein Ddye_016063 [Dipteronia dyeriana]